MTIFVLNIERIDLKKNRPQFKNSILKQPLLPIFLFYFLTSTNLYLFYRCSNFQLLLTFRRNDNDKCDENMS